MKYHATIKTTIEHNNTHYEVFALQGAYDEIIFNTQTIWDTDHKSYRIPIKKCAGMAWKCNKMSMSNQNGSAAEILQLFSEFDAFMQKSIEMLIFNNPNRDKLRW